jgi:hypothetical protein
MGTRADFGCLTLGYHRNLASTRGIAKSYAPLQRRARTWEQYFSFKIKLIQLNKGV